MRTDRCVLHRAGVEHVIGVIGVRVRSGLAAAGSSADKEEGASEPRFCSPGKT